MLQTITHQYVIANKLEHIKLFHREINGYIAIAKQSPTGLTQLGSFTMNELEKMDLTHVDYFTPNAARNRNRKADEGNNVAAYTCLFVDLDYKEINKPPREIYKRVYNALSELKAPEPNCIVYSGRGAHLYYFIDIEYRPSNEQWKHAQDNLIELFINHNADTAIRDPLRFLRLAGTTNNKSPAYQTEMSVLHDEIYTLSQFDELTSTQTKQKPIKQQLQTRKPRQLSTIQNVKYLYNAYSLALARLQDIETLVSLRRGRITGKRELLLWIYRICWTQLESPEIALQHTLDLNNLFTSPLPKKEIESKTSNAKQYGKIGNAYIIQTLSISSEEQQHLKTLITQQEKNRRRKSKRQLVKINICQQWSTDITACKFDIEQLQHLWKVSRRTVFRRLKQANETLIE